MRIECPHCKRYIVLTERDYSEEIIFTCGVCKQEFKFSPNNSEKDTNND